MLIRQDIVIVDTKSDLNIYIDIANEGRQESEDVTGCCNSLVVEAASKTARETLCYTENVGNCCLKGLSKATDSEHVEVNRCSKLCSNTHSDVAAPWRFADIDINEWAGKFSIQRLYVAHIR